MSHYLNIIFDVGNVLFGYDPAFIIDQLLPRTLYTSIYLDHLFNDPIWLELDRGTLFTTDAIAHLSSFIDDRSTLTREVPCLIEGFAHHLTAHTDCQMLFEHFSKTRATYILSNFQTHPFQTLLKNNPFMHLAKGIVVSADEQCAKPDEAIYRILLERYQLDPRTCFFIDDRIENIQAAKALGIDGVVFQSADQLKTCLKEQGLLSCV